MIWLTFEINPLKTKWLPQPFKKNWHGGSGGHFSLIISWYWWTEPTAECSCHQLMAIFSEKFVGLHSNLTFFTIWTFEKDPSRPQNEGGFSNRHSWYKILGKGCHFSIGDLYYATPHVSRGIECIFFAACEPTFLFQGCVHVVLKKLSDQFVLQKINFFLCFLIVHWV